jgi:hypothetical protein
VPFVRQSLPQPLWCCPNWPTENLTWTGVFELSPRTGVQDDSPGLSSKDDQSRRACPELGNGFLTHALKPIPFRFFFWGEFLRRSFAAVWYRERFDGLRPSVSAHGTPHGTPGQAGRIALTNGSTYPRRGALNSLSPKTRYAALACFSAKLRLDLFGIIAIKQFPRLLRILGPSQAGFGRIEHSHVRRHY